MPSLNLVSTTHASLQALVADSYSNVKVKNPHSEESERWILGALFITIISFNSLQLFILI